MYTKIFSGKKFTYLDDAVKAKSHVPNKFYETMLTIKLPGKSNLDKQKRKLLSDEIADYERRNKFPAPNAHSPNHKALSSMTKEFS